MAAACWPWPLSSTRVRVADPSTPPPMSTLTAATLRAPFGLVATETPPLGTVGGDGDCVHQPTEVTGTSAEAGTGHVTDMTPPAPTTVAAATAARTATPRTRVKRFPAIAL